MRCPLFVNAFIKCTLVVVRYLIFLFLREFITTRNRIYNAIRNISSKVPTTPPPTAAPVVALLEASCDVSPPMYAYGRTLIVHPQNVR